MTKENAASLIEAIADSIEQYPTQFSFNIKIIGTQAVAQSGGVGLSVTAVGGGPGSRTVGYQSSVTVDDATISRGQEIGVQNLAEITRAIREIATETRSSSPDTGKIQSLIVYLADRVAPPLVVSMIVQLLNHAHL